MNGTISFMNIDRDKGDLKLVFSWSEATVPVSEVILQLILHMLINSGAQILIEASDFRCCCVRGGIGASDPYLEARSMLWV